MTISSSLKAGVAGLNVNATRLATISDNIANSATFGYKRAVTDFQSLVINGNSRGVYSAGGVRVSTFRQVDERGPLTTSSNPTDLAVSGRGMLPVTSTTEPDAPTIANLLLVPTGSFRPDSRGYLRNDAGHVLLGWPVGSDGQVPAAAKDSVAGLSAIRVDMNQFAGDPTTRMNLALNLPASETAAGSTGESRSMTVEYFGNLGTSERLSFAFEPVIPAQGASNAWRLTIGDSASGGDVVAEFDLVFDDSREGGGTLATVTPVTGGTYDALTGTLSIEVAGGPMEVVIGRPGAIGGISQFSDRFAPLSVSKDGSPVGNLVSVEVDRSGMLFAVYDIGFTRPIYQIPVVDVPNPNGLISAGNEAYVVSPESGSFLLWEAGTGPAGTILGFSREESATDVASELTQLIQTQRAYSSNAKVIQTVDEMLQETTNIKR